MTPLRRWTLALALTLAGISASLPAGATTEPCNKAPNSGFAQYAGSTPTAWNLGVFSGSATSTMAFTEYHTAPPSVRVSVSTPGDINLRTAEWPGALPVGPTSTYKLTAWLKAQFNARAALRVIEWNGSGVQADRFLTSNAGTGSWEKLEGTFTTGAQTTALSIRLVHHISPGVFYWDDVTLEPASCDLATPCPSGNCLPAPTSPCASDGIMLAIRPYVAQGNIDLPGELDDWAALYLDARGGGACAQAAAGRWVTRLRNAASKTVCDSRQGYSCQIPYYQQWLAGGIISHVFAAAKEFDYRAIPTAPDVPSLLSAARSSYAQIREPQDYYCGMQSLQGTPNSCMEDFALTASGFAWVAAMEYQKKRDPSFWIQKAQGSLSNALTSMAEGGSNGGGPCVEDLTLGAHNCDGTMATFTPTRYRVIGLDHGMENPNYGIGNMTSVASACAGLFAAGTPCQFSWQQETVARELFLTAQQRTSLDGCDWDPRGCRDWAADRQGQPAERPCDDSVFLSLSPDRSYKPQDFPLKLFYEKRQISGLLDAATAFQFDTYCEPRTTYPPYYDKLWGPNRLAFYGIFGHDLFLPDVQPPSVGISQPPSGTTVSGVVLFSVNAADNNSVTNVRYYADGAGVTPFCSAGWPFDCLIDTSSGNVDGSYAVFAKAFDAAGNMMQSGTIYVTVSNPH